VNSTPFFVHGFFEVENLHDAKVIGLDGGLQGNRSFTHGLSVDNLTSIGTFILNRSLITNITPSQGTRLSCASSGGVLVDCGGTF
jgi:hypothetical protein